MSGRFHKLGTSMLALGRRAALGVAIAGGAALVGIKKSIDAASDLNESLSKVGVVFGPKAKGIIDWSKNAATAMGQSQQQALEAVGTFGNLISATGVAAQKTRGMSTVMVQLASDLASFNNADPSEVLVNLRAGLVGEAEPLRKFGVQLNAARIEETALRLGLSKEGEELSAAAKMQAAYSIILSDTTTAQGDFARTADGAANKQRIVAAQFEDLKAKVGQVFLPVWQTMLGWFSKGIEAFQQALPDIMRVGKALFEGIGGALRVVVDWLGRVWKAIGPAVIAFGKALFGALRKAWKAIQKDLWPALVNLWHALQPIFKVVAVVVGVIIILAAKALPFAIRAISRTINMVAGFVNAIRGAIDWIGKVVGWLKDKLVGAFNAVKDVGKGIWDGILGAATTVFNAIARAWNSTVGKLSFRAPGWVPFVGGKGFDVPDIPLLDTGGVVLNTGLAVVHKGEEWSGVGQHRRWGGDVRVGVNIDRRRWVAESDYEVTYGGL